MADVHDDDQWLYGDEKEDGKDEENDLEPDDEASQNGEALQDEYDPQNITEDGDMEGKTREKEAVEQEREGEDDEAGVENNDENEDKHSSSDEDDLTVTIGEVKKQADIIQPTAHQARFQPKAAPTSGLKDDDFNTIGKVNGTPIVDFDVAEYEDKPWRKPGADLSDYFNYGFVEETWLKYCEKQKKMRINESKTGLGGLNMNKPLVNKMVSQANITVPLINENSKYCMQRKVWPTPRTKVPGSNDFGTPEVNSIQVMTADRRSYSSKTYSSDNMDFGGDLYGSTPYFSTETPPPNFYNPPPQFRSGDNWTGNMVGTPPPPSTNNWNSDSPVPTGPPPGFAPVTSVPPPTSVYDDDGSRGRRISPDDDRHKLRRNHGRRSRSPSRHRRRSRSRSRSKSRSRSPSHRHKRKKSKRERENE